MCIICVSKPGVRQPDENTIRTMFLHKPHGAGYMVARDGRVIIHKGFMNPDEYLRAVRQDCLLYTSGKTTAAVCVRRPSPGS